MEFCGKVESDKLKELFGTKRRLNAFIDLKATYMQIESDEADKKLGSITNEINCLTHEYEKILKQIRRIIKMPVDTHPNIHIFEDGSVFEDKVAK
jgi:hypothetical protein